MASTTAASNTSNNISNDPRKDYIIEAILDMLRSSKSSAPVGSGAGGGAGAGAASSVGAELYHHSALDKFINTAEVLLLSAYSVLNDEVNMHTRCARSLAVHFGVLCVVL